MPGRDDEDHTLDGLVHDLSNVFETIQDSAALLAKDPRHSRLAASIERNVRRGQRILTSYFDHAQASLDAELIIDSAIEFAGEFLAAVKGPKLEFVRTSEQGLRLPGNPADWERVLINLFLNAAQAMGEHGGAVEIHASRGEQGIGLVVSDNGPGISPKILPRIFEPGFSTRAKRSGLGLHIVRTLVEQCGGTVTASNRPNAQGALFQITVPLAPA